MDNLQLETFVREIVPQAEIKTGKQFLEVTVTADSLHNLAKKLQGSGDTSFDFLFCLSGVDHGQDLGVVYHLRSTAHNHSLVLKTRCSDRVSPKLPSVSDIWLTAEFLENEVFDLLGIEFENHPHPRRLFLEEGAGFPLRKDFTDSINIVSK